MKARLYGTSSRIGKVVDFKVLDKLPEIGERVQWNIENNIYRQIEPARLDPEQRTSDETEIGFYDFYEALTGEPEEELDECMSFYFCIRNESEL